MSECDIKDDLKYNKVNKQPSVHLANNVQPGLSQNNAPWVLPGSHMWRNHVCCPTLRACILSFADFYFHYLKYANLK